MKLASAVFYSSDISLVTQFYRDFLGLKVNYIVEGKFASFNFENGVRLGIKKAVEEREKPGGQTVFVSVVDLDEWYKKCKEAGVGFYKELVTESWGREFAILDPDKNKVTFVE